MEGKRFVLEKRPNLLSATLLLPLVGEQASEEHASAIGKQLGVARQTGPFRQAITYMPKHVPCMKVEVDKPSKTSTIRIFAPYQLAGVPTEYVSVVVDCKIDVERSILTLQGDHLACRLAFTEYSSARDCREERESRHPAALELSEQPYHDYGVQCANCQCELVEPGVLSRAHRAPRLPWAELVECMTCVNLEEYVDDSSLAKFSAEGSQRRVTPELGSVIVSEAHLCVFGQAAASKRLELCDYASPPLLLNESEENSKCRRWRVARCAQCKAWVGDARTGDEDGGDHGELKEIRLFKFAVQTSQLFAHYLPESVVCGAVVDAAFSRECYRFVLAFENVPVVRLVLLSYDSWLSTHLSPTLRPVIKFLFWDDMELDPTWAQRTGAEWIGLPDRGVCDTVRKKLCESNLWLPHSMRALPDKSRVGFLYW